MRAGVISRERLAEVVGDELLAPASGAVAAASGTTADDGADAAAS